MGNGGDRPGTHAIAWSLAASGEEKRAHIQDRLSLLSKLMFLVFWILVGFLLAMYEVYPQTRPEDADIIHVFAYAGLALLAGIWFVWLRADRKPSLRTLYVIDAVYGVLIGTVFGISGYYSAGRPANVYSAFIWTTFMLFTRVIIVPSTAKRTVWFSLAAMAPLVVSAVLLTARDPAGVDIPVPAFLVGELVFIAVAILLVRTGSRVIYGLRKQVREAQQLGQYTLDEKIGEGGMGAVYKAHHAMLRRPTAIKLLPPDKFGEESLQRFEREVQHTSLLAHPNTVAIYDYGRSPDGVFYYAMEYLDGIDLEDLVRQYGPQPAGRVVHILGQVCGALAEAHERGLIHRDIKPANILLCHRGGIPDVAKVLDFGLVKDLGRDATGSHAQVVAGTPAYISPEAVTDPESVSPATDLYMLGCVGYFLLTARTVFEATNEVDMCVHHVSSQPTPPSARSSNTIPAALEQLLMRCLDKSPSKRPESAEAMAAALEDVDTGDDWTRALAHEWWRAHGERARGRPAGPPTAVSPLMMTIDLRGRTGARDHDDDTDQAT